MPIVHAVYEIYLKFNGLVVKFPKTQRHNLGQTTTTYILAVLENVIAGAGSLNHPSKLQYLRQASLKLDALKILIRLCRDCQCIEQREYLEIETKLHEAGRMLGGWIKNLDSNKGAR